MGEDEKVILTPYLIKENPDNSNLLIKEPDPEIELEKCDEMAVVVDCAKLNVRKRPSKTSEVLYVLKVGEEVMVCKKENDWYNIHNFAGISGYAMSKFLKII